MSKRCDYLSDGVRNSWISLFCIKKRVLGPLCHIMFVTRIAFYAKPKSCKPAMPCVVFVSGRTRTSFTRWRSNVDLIGWQNSTFWSAVANLLG